MATMVKGDSKGAAVAGDRKKLSRKELRTPKGRFAAHLLSLLKERGWTSQTFAEESGFKEPTIRSWLRADSAPNLSDLEALGNALGLEDYRDILPPKA